jgi:hypothetical protein
MRRIHIRWGMANLWRILTQNADRGTPGERHCFTDLSGSRMGDRDAIRQTRVDFGRPRQNVQLAFRTTCRYGNRVVADKMPIVN